MTDVDNAPAPAPNKTNKGTILGLACIIGVVLFIVGTACFFLLGGDVSTLLTGVITEEAFLEELRQFDASAAVPEARSRRLDTLEKKARSAESYLSFLKRRRLLALHDLRFILSYQESARKATRLFPLSEPCAAIMVEALLLEREQNAGLTKTNGSIAKTNGSIVKIAGALVTEIPQTTDTELRVAAARLTQERFKPLALSCYALLGLLSDPEKAAHIPNKTMLFPTSVLERFNTATLNRESAENPLPLIKGDAALIIDYLILRLMDGEYEEVMKALNAMPDFNPVEEAALSHFAAEFFYDYGNALRAAEIFSRFPPETVFSYVARQADALWVAGYVPAARTIWTALGASDREEDRASKARSLYNLAATAPDKTQEAAFLKRQLALRYDTCHDLGVIRYSRLLPVADALEILQEHGSRTMEQTTDDPLSESAFSAPQNAPLMALELVRRRMETGTLRRAVAETWLLLNKYPEDAQLYEWACYFFNYQRRYDETELLVKNAGYHDISGVWLDMHEALRMAREGLLADSLALLVKLPEDAHWQIPANIARIQEARRSPTAALGYYEKAASLAHDKIQGARIQFRIALCLRTLDRDAESRDALRRALELDPDYLSARLELRRPVPATN